jgi:hypothetical protein
MEMPMEKQSKEEELAASYELYDKELETDENLEICKVNPTLFRKLKFKVRISPEAAMPKSDALTKAMQLEEYALAMANPLTDKEAVTRDLLLGSFEKTRDNTDKYMMKPQTSPVPNGEPIQNPAQQGKVKQPTAELPSQPPASLMRKLQ